MTKALVLFSGGLDSLLAAKLLQEQGVEVTALCFESNFFDAEKAKTSARKIGVPLRVIDINREELDLVKNPPHGYGKHLNPCLDCHAQMVRLAGVIARHEGFDLVATGEVLGQRPFSQNRQALMEINRLSGADILRPLSAKLLPETEAELRGLVERGRLGAVKGRGREAQISLAKRFAITGYPTPAGGCLLTDPEFSSRLAKLLEYRPDCGTNDVEALKSGRVFWLKAAIGGHIMVTVGRHNEDNIRLNELAKKGDIMVELKEMTGPSALIRYFGTYAVDAPKSKEYKQKIPVRLKLSEYHLDRPKSGEEALVIAGLLTGYYSTKARNKECIIRATWK